LKLISRKEGGREVRIVIGKGGEWLIIKWRELESKSEIDKRNGRKGIREGIRVEKKKEERRERGRQTKLKKLNSMA
jgi:hypothetical protein